MTEIRAQIGRYGAWVSSRVLTPEVAPGLETAGYGALWIGGADSELTDAEQALDATSTLVVATGIVNVWKTDAPSLARAYHRVAARHGDRFVLGVGTGHREAFEQYQRPYETLAAFVDTLLDAGVPADRMVLAALGPKVLRLAAETLSPASRAVLILHFHEDLSLPDVAAPVAAYVPARCSRPSTRWCSIRTRSAAGRSAGRPSSGTSAWSTTRPTCAGSGSPRTTSPAAAATGWSTR